MIVVSTHAREPKTARSPHDIERSSSWAGVGDVARGLLQRLGLPTAQVRREDGKKANRMIRERLAHGSARAFIGRVRQVGPFLIGFAAGVAVRGWNAWVAASTDFVVDDLFVIAVAVIARAVYVWRCLRRSGRANLEVR